MSESIRILTLSYLFPMLLISGILFMYYRLFLKNAPFHGYNRWYLLGIAAASLLLPLLPLPFPAIWPEVTGHPAIIVDQAAGKDLSGQGILLPKQHPVATGHPGTAIWGAAMWWYMLAGVYITGTAFYLFRLFISLFRMVRLARQHSKIKMEGCWFYETSEPGAPFSFFNRLFWNRNIPLETEQGQSIFRHEYYHIRQRHTLDLLLLEMIRILFWFNPFFYLLLRELKVVHEFMADRYALARTSARAEYAEWLVWQSIREYRPLHLTHSFYNAHLKRRITMIMSTKSSNARAGFLTRILAIPVLFLLFSAFGKKRPSAEQAYPLLEQTDPFAKQADPFTKQTDPFTSQAGPFAKQTDTSVEAIIRRAPHPRTPDDFLLLFYMYQLRYPETAIRQQQEGTISFSIKIGEQNQLLEFRTYAEGVLKGEKVHDIIVTAKAKSEAAPITANAEAAESAGAAKAAGGNEPEPAKQEQDKTLFTIEAKKVAAKIAAETRTYGPGEYFFTITFKLEKPASKQSPDHSPSAQGFWLEQFVPGRPPGQGC